MPVACLSLDLNAPYRSVPFWPDVLIAGTIVAPPSCLKSRFLTLCYSPDTIAGSY